MANVKLVVQTDAAGTVAALREVTAQLDQTGKKAKEADSSLKGAFSGELQGRLQGLAGSTGSFGSVLTALGPGGIAAGAALAAATVAAGAFANELSRVIATSGTLTDLAAKVSVSTQALQELAYAGSLVGVSQEAIVAAMGKAQVSLADGSDRTIQALDRLGLSLVQLQLMKPEEQFKTLAEAIRGIQNPTEQAGVAAAIFGRSFREVLPLMKSDLAGAAEEAQRFGAVWSEATVGAGDAAGDNLTRLSAAFEGLKTAVVEVVLTTPQFQAVLADAVDLMGELVGIAKDSAPLIAAFFQPIAQAGDMIRTAEMLARARMTRDGLTMDTGPNPNVGTPAIAQPDLSFGSAMGGAAALKMLEEQLKDSAAETKTLERNAQDAERELARFYKEQVSGLKQWDDALASNRAKLEEQAAKREAYVSQFGMTSDQATLEMERLRFAFEALAEQGPVSVAQLQSFIDKMAPLEKAGGSSREALQLLNAALLGVSAAAGDEGKFVDEGSRRAELALERQARQAEETRRRWLELYDTLSGFADLAGALGFEGLANALSDAVGFMEQFDEAAKDGVISWGELASLIAGIVGAFKRATDSASGFSRALNTALLGASVGSKIGGLFGPMGAAIGGAIGGVVGAVVGIFKKPSWVKAGKEAGKVLGMAVSEELAKAIEKTAKSLNITAGQAALLHISDAIKESGQAASTFLPQMTQLMDAIASGSIPAKQGLEALGEAFGQLRAEAEASGDIVNVALSQFMQAARSKGTMTAEMRDFVAAQLEAAAKGLAAGIGTLEKGGLRIVSEQDAINQATVFALVFNQTLAERGLLAAADTLGPILQALKDKMTAAGFGEAAAAILAPIEQQMALATNEAFRSATEGARGFADTLAGIAQAGLPMTIQQFQAFQGTAQSAFDQAKQAAIEQGLTIEEANTAAFAAIAPLLQALVQASEAYGFTLDAQTQSLVDQAKASGVAFATSPIDRAASAMERVADALEKVFGLTRATADAMGDLGDNASGVTVGGVTPRDPGALPGFASGGIFNASSTGSLAVLHGREAVLTLPQLYGEMAGVVASRTAALVGAGPVSTSGGRGAGEDLQAVVAELVAVRKAIEASQVVVQNRFQVGDQVLADKLQSFKRRGVGRS